MKTDVSFCAAFADSELGMSGRCTALARYFANRLKENGYTCMRTMSRHNISGFRCAASKRRFDVVVCFVGADDREWLIVTQGTLAWARRAVLKATDKNQHLQLTCTLHAIMQGEDRFSDVRWYTREEWNTPHRKEWSLSPEAGNVQAGGL
jgi:hypothetical protein